MVAVLRLTQSELMALRSLVMEHMLCPGRTEEYRDVANSDVTTPGQLLIALMNEVWEEAP